MDPVESRAAKGRLLKKIRKCPIAPQRWKKWSSRLYDKSEFEYRVRNFGKKWDFKNLAHFQVFFNPPLYHSELLVQLDFVQYAAEADSLTLEIDLS